MRQFQLSTPDLVAVLAHPIRTSHDRRGNVRVGGLVRGVEVRIVIASDDHNAVITVFERRRGRES
jgi:hypothetical protein